MVELPRHRYCGQTLWRAKSGNRLLAELSQPRKKSIVVIAGANGSGKSTLVEGLELKYEFAHIDPDNDCQRRLGGEGPLLGWQKIHRAQKHFVQK